MRRSSARQVIGCAVALLLLAVPAGATPADTPASAAADRDSRLEGRYIVVLRDGVDGRAVIAQYAESVRAGRRYTNVFSGFAGRMTSATAAVLAADPRVATVETDGLMHRADAQGWPTWGLDRIDQPRRNLNQTYAYNSHGRGVAVYVIDGGVYGDHREFGDRVEPGFDVTGQGARRDCDGHGTHIAGTVGGRRFGVAKQVRIVPVRVVDCSTYIRRSNVIAGLDYVVRDHRKGAPAVVNISLGGPASKVADRAVNRVIDDGVTVVTAAGNQGINACSTSPARVGRVLTVGAVNRYDWSPNWSNYGSCVDVFAPGVKIKSAGIGSPTDTRRASGTSMAAPHVAGVVARYLSTHRRATPAAIHRHVVSTATRQARHTGPSTTSRMLYVPGKVPTALGNRISRDRVDPDDYVTVSTRLRNALTSAGIGQQSVVLQGRRPSESTWTRLARRTTTSLGRATFVHQPGRRMEYRWRHQGSSRTRPATSAVAELGFRRWRAHLEFRYPSELIGELTATDTGYPLRGYVVQLHERTEASDTWVHLEALETDQDGRVDFTRLPVPGTEYRLEHTGTSQTRPAVSHIYAP